MNILNHLPAGWGKNKGNGEYSGPCPRCGGEDRFVVWPEHPSGATGGKYLCHQCAPEGGDGIQFLRDFQGLGYAEACREFGKESDTHHRESTSPARQEWAPQPEREPGEKWQVRATAFLDECAANIEQGPGLEYLTNRGLALETGRRFRIGFNPADRYEAPEVWGLEPRRNYKGNLSKLYLPAGLVFPILRKSGVLTVKIRRRDWTPQDEWPKYHAVKGGGHGCLVIGKPGLPVVLVESELDAFLLAQDAGDLCSVVALANASNKPDEKTTNFLRSAECILYALDFDEAGKKPLAWWSVHFPGVRVWPPSVGKDLGDMVSDGESLVVWVQAALSPDEQEPAAHATALDPATDYDLSLLVDCPRRGKRIHCGYCSRCPETSGCGAWRSHRADVEFFRTLSEPPASLDRVEALQ